MQLKKSIIFSISDVQEAVALIAVKQGVIARELTQLELKEIIENGSLCVEMDYVEKKPVALDTHNLLPTQFFRDLGAMVQGLSVFVKNIEQDVLYGYFTDFIDLTKEGDLIKKYYAAKSAQFPEPGPKEIYGENWREKWDQLRAVCVSIGQNFLFSLQQELRKNPTILKGSKGFTKDSIIEDVKDLGFSKRLEGPFSWSIRRENITSFILGEYVDKKKISDMYSWRNIGKKAIKEYEDFILLYNL